MKVVITEDIVRNALNESIDEFMLEEGWLGDTWNNLKNNTVAGKWLSKTGNWLNNGINMFMDVQTNGQWNRQYNSPVRGKGNTVGVFYLEKWITPHHNRLYDIVYGDYYGNRQYFYTPLNGRNASFRHDPQSNSYTTYNDYLSMVYRLTLDYYGNPEYLALEEYNGTEIQKSPRVYNRTDGSYEFKFNTIKYDGTIKVFSAEDDTTPEEYIAKNCTPNAFIAATQNTLGDGYFKSAVIEYLRGIQQEISNPNKKPDYNTLINQFTTDSFINWFNKVYKPRNPKGKQTAQQPNNTQPIYTQPQLAANNKPTVNNQQAQPVGRKDPNWLPTNKVPIFKTK